MKRLTVLYDAECGFCVKCRWWLSKQPKFVEMEFIAAGAPEAVRRFPELAEDGEELIVVGDDGAVYRGARAWLMCLWALQEYREWSLDLASPALLPLARAAFGIVSAGRRKISSLLGLPTEEELRGSPPPPCAE